MMNGQTQLRLDFGKPKATQKKAKTHNVKCQNCSLPINLILQSEREFKACPHCGDRDWLLNLKTAESCVLYGIKPETLGGRLREDRL